MTALNYTSTAGDPALDRAFEAALAAARAGTEEPLSHLVGGEPVAEGEIFERADPCDASRIVSRARQAPAAVIARAVAAARAAQPAWAATPLAERIAALRGIAGGIAERWVELAGVVAAETGKVRMEAVPEVQEGIDLIEAYCADMEAPRRLPHPARPAVRGRGQRFCGWKGSGMSGKGGLGPHYLPQFMREQSRTVMRVKRRKFGP
ncbi:MAG TPA: aldehyde dehydrogenase family protein [Solirubrobacteraceae bacterium]|jgi:acyl-CoA reductase-like NAD-dependent aldehyde dehydrogenase|nr:aldehyde dehydrogenase family protein [Solirubrobacteraceae bacterium]